MKPLMDLLNDLTLREYEALLFYMWTNKLQCTRVNIKHFRKSIGKNNSDINVWEDT